MLTWAFEPGEPSINVADPGSQWDDDAPTLGPYALVEEIGRGGMGVIHRGVHRETREVVALKTILPQYAGDPEILARFRREAEMAQSFDHPHTMPILEVGRPEAGSPFFTMPLASGGSLHHLKARYRRRWRRIAELIAKVARAIHHAHHRGVLHRDIKPSNILFTEDYEPLIADFGLARPLVDTDDLTRSCAVLGTPNYVAPEQAAGATSDLTASTDVYSLGAVLYELLTGRPPFVGNNPLDVLRQVSTKTPVRPRRLEPAVPEALEQICLRCLERDPANRYLSAQELADHLERWLAGRPVTPWPGYLRLRSFCGRHPLIWVWGGIIGALLIALPSVSKIRERPAVARPTTSVAMVIDELEPSATSRRMVRQLADQLGQHLLASGEFCIQGPADGRLGAGAAPLDTLAYGRSVSAQTVLTSYLRQVGSQSHLVTRFVRCDTGETFWQHRDVLSPEQAADLPTVSRELVTRLKQSWNDGRGDKARTSIQPLAEAQNFYTHAMELASHGNRRDLELAIALFQRAQEMDPHFAQAGAMLALARWMMGCAYGCPDQLALAEATARTVLVLDSDSATAHRVIASCYLQQARYDRAREEFETAVELDPDSAGCCQSLGICLRQMGHPAQAISWLRRAVQLEPARGSHSTSLGEALILCGLDEWAEAAFARAAELDAERPGTQFGMVALRVWQKRYEEARSLCLDARRRFPDHKFGLNFAAWVELCDGRLAEARSYYETLRAGNSYQEQWEFHGGINPASALAYIALQSGEVERAQILADEALLVDRELLTKYPHNNRILHDIAATYAVLGDQQNALGHLEQAIAAGWAEHRSTRIDPRFNGIAQLSSFETLLENTKPKYTADVD